MSHLKLEHTLRTKDSYVRKLLMKCFNIYDKLMIDKLLSIVMIRKGLKYFEIF